MLANQWFPAPAPPSSAACSSLTGPSLPIWEVRETVPRGTTPLHRLAGDLCDQFVITVVMQDGDMLSFGYCHDKQLPAQPGNLYGYLPDHPVMMEIVKWFARLNARPERKPSRNVLISPAAAARNPPVAATGLDPGNGLPPRSVFVLNSSCHANLPGTRMWNDRRR